MLIPKPEEVDAARYTALRVMKRQGKDDSHEKCEKIIGFLGEIVFARFIAKFLKNKSISRKQKEQLRRVAENIANIADFEYDILIGLLKIDVKTSTKNYLISSKRINDVCYVFMKAITGNEFEDTKFEIAGWCWGYELEKARPHLNAEFCCEKLHSKEELFALILNANGSPVCGDVAAVGVRSENSPQNM
jgi:hypothetical protein